MSKSNGPQASAIAHAANDKGTTLREAALASGDMDTSDFDHSVDPKTMVGQTTGPRPDGSTDL
jgi:fumarate hydratase class II